MADRTKSRVSVQEGRYGVLKCALKDLGAMSKPVIRVLEAEAANNFRSLLARVRAGAEVVIERDTEAVAVIRPVASTIRLLSESVRLACAARSGSCAPRQPRTRARPRRVSLRTERLEIADVSQSFANHLLLQLADEVRHLAHHGAAASRRAETTW